jgi:hypothetical protein
VEFVVAFVVNIPPMVTSSCVVATDGINLIASVEAGAIVGQGSGVGVGGIGVSVGGIGVWVFVGVLRSRSDPQLVRIKFKHTASMIWVRYFRVKVVFIFGLHARIRL